MKKTIFCISILFITVNLPGKDLIIRIDNQNNFSIDLYVGTLTSGQNISDDDEVIANRNKFGISNLGKTIQGNKEAEFIKTGIKKNMFIIVFGQFKGGGRTEIKRFSTNDVWDSEIIEIVFEPTNTISPTKSFVNVIDGFNKLNSTGAYMVLDNIELLGTFLLFRPKTDSSDMLVYPIIPNKKVVSERYNTKSTQIEDILSSEANGSINIEFPMATQIKGIFGTSKIVSLVWVIKNCGPKTFKPENGSFYDLYLSCTEKDRKLASQEFLKSPLNTKLLFIRNAFVTDTVRLETFSLTKLEFGTQLNANDIADISGNYKRSSTSSLKSKEVNLIKDVYGLDFSVILRSEYDQLQEAISKSVIEEYPKFILKGDSLKAVFYIRKDTVPIVPDKVKVENGVRSQMSNASRIDFSLLEEAKKKLINEMY